MKFGHFFIPVIGDEGVLEECNRFLSSKKILAVDRHFTEVGNIPGWSILIYYDDINIADLR